MCSARSCAARSIRVVTRSDSKVRSFIKVTNFVVDQMKDAFPELETQRDFIEKMVRLEEERFGSTLTVGLNKLEELFASTEARCRSTKSWLDSTTPLARRET